MHHATATTIRATLARIERREIVLPAIQREFVWKPEQICKLFDSLLRGYPIGQLLYWLVRGENLRRWRWYDPVTDWHEKDAKHCPAHGDVTDSGQMLTAVLDGQQRLTALNVGLRGSLAPKLPRYWWDNPGAFPKRRMHLILDDEVQCLTQGETRFRWLTSEEGEKAGGAVFPCREVLSFDDANGPADWVEDHLEEAAKGIRREARQRLTNLYETVVLKERLAAFEVESNDLHDVVEIFIRTNSGGTRLGHADLLLAMVSAEWPNGDAREAIHGLTDKVQKIGRGFPNIEKDLVLKAALLMCDAPRVDFKVDNFSSETVKEIEKRWKEIDAALTATFDLMAQWGYDGGRLRHTHSPLVIAYWIQQTKCARSIATHPKQDKAVEAMRSWMARSTAKPRGVWSGGNDTFLVALRKVVREDRQKDEFPAKALEREMERLGRGIRFTEDEIREVLNLEWGSPSLPAVFNLLGMLSMAQEQEEVDHIWPRSLLQPKRLEREGLPPEDVEWLVSHRDTLANLQPLPQGYNRSKGETGPKAWMMEPWWNSPKNQALMVRNRLDGIPENTKEARKWLEARRAGIEEILRNALM